MKNDHIMEQQKWLSLLMFNITNQLSGISTTTNKDQTFTIPFLEGKGAKDTSLTSSEALMTKIQYGLEKIDKLRLENFNLKKQIAYDKKKYLDLKNAYLELKLQAKTMNEDLFEKQPDIQLLINEKHNL